MRYLTKIILIATLVISGVYAYSVPVQAAGSACSSCLQSALTDCAGFQDSDARSQCVEDLKKDGGTCRTTCNADEGTCIYCVTNAGDNCMINSNSPQGCVDAIFSNNQCASECKTQGGGGGGNGPGGGAGGNTPGTGINLTIQGIFNIFIGLTCWFMRVAFLLIVIAIVWSGILFTISQGDLEKYTKAKASLGYALLGALVILGVYVIIYTIANAVGVEVTFFSCSGSASASTISIN